MGQFDQQVNQSQLWRRGDNTGTSNNNENRTSTDSGDDLAEQVQNSTADELSNCFDVNKLIESYLMSVGSINDLDEKLVVNLSDHVLTDDEKSVLRKV